MRGRPYNYRQIYYGIIAVIGGENGVTPSGKVLMTKPDDWWRVDECFITNQVYVTDVATMRGFGKPPSRHPIPCHACEHVRKWTPKH